MSNLTFFVFYIKIMTIFTWKYNSGFQLMAMLAALNLSYEEIDILVSYEFEIFSISSLWMYSRLIFKTPWSKVHMQEYGRLWPFIVSVGIT